MLSYIFNPVVVNTYPNTYADTWLMFNITYRLVYIYRHIVGFTQWKHVIMIESIDLLTYTDTYLIQ